MESSLSKQRFYLGLGFLLCGLAVGLGAFGAHGLEKILSDKAMATYQTGVEYHFLHALAIIACALIIQQGYTIQSSFWAFLIGIIVFSGSCYAYAFTGIRGFALIVPLGGVSFLIGWFLGAYNILKSRPS
jgi:uncharacterized membrane protein YgdD (TMEM256/DUF423 family)